ncbi:MAG: alpha-E domain-containing protein [Succinivibrionaceae bacterium]
MLSRTASHLFWMARYIERAENLTRLIHVTQTFALMPESKGGRIELASPLAITGLSNEFAAIYKNDLSFNNVCSFFACNPNNPASIANCITKARENAHAVRGTITPDIWEGLNETYINACSMIKEGLNEDNFETFFDKVVERYQNYYGAMLSTMQHSDAYMFAKAGHMIERADNTARAINVKYQTKNSKNVKNQDKAIEYHQLSSLLRAMSAYEAYHSAYGDSIVPEKVAEFLILSNCLPRSLYFCVHDLNRSLNSIEGTAGLEPKRLTAELEATLKYSTIDECMTSGLDNFINRFLTNINKIGTAISHSYLEAV